MIWGDHLKGKHVGNTFTLALRRTNLGFTGHFPEDKEDGQDGKHGVGKNEGGDVPTTRKEDFITTDEGHDQRAKESIVPIKGY